MNNMKKVSLVFASILLIAVMIALTLTTFAALGVNKNLNSSGSITHSANLGVYSDSACTVPLTTIDWGSISPGNTATQTLYVKNTGSISLTLSMTASNWSPASANGPLTVTWNRESATLGAGQSTSATLTLAVSSSITEITSFSVQINIAGTSL